MIAEEEWREEEIEAARRVIAQIEEEIEDLCGADPERLAERQPEDLPPGYRRTPKQIEDRVEHQIGRLRAEKGAFRFITLPEEEKDEIREARAEEEMRADAARW
jgi:leucyl-tRNA synthetase